MNKFTIKLIRDVSLDDLFPSHDVIIILDNKIIVYDTEQNCRETYKSLSEFRKFTGVSKNDFYNMYEKPTIKEDVKFLKAMHPNAKRFLYAEH